MWLSGSMYKAIGLEYVYEGWRFLAVKEVTEHTMELRIPGHVLLVW